MGRNGGRPVRESQGNRVLHQVTELIRENDPGRRAELEKALGIGQMEAVEAAIHSCWGSDLMYELYRYRLGSSQERRQAVIAALDEYGEEDAGFDDIREEAIEARTTGHWNFGYPLD